MAGARLSMRRLPLRWRPVPRAWVCLGLTVLAAVAWCLPGTAASRSDAAPNRPSTQGVRAIAALPLASLAAPAPQAAAKPGTVQRSLTAWSIAAGDASRAELARQLAIQSGSRVQGDLVALGALPPLPEKLPDLDLAAAWRLILGNSNHALHCTAATCTVWVLGTLPSAPTNDGGRPAIAAPADPPGLFPAEAAPDPA